MDEMNEKLDEMREDFEDLRDAWVAQTRAENIALAEMLHLLWGIALQGLGTCTILSELGRDISPEAQVKVNKAWADAQKRIDSARECSQALADALGGGLRWGRRSLSRARSAARP